MATSTNEIAGNAPTWWEIQNIPTEMVRELRRRNNSNNVGMQIPNPFVNATFDFANNHSKYKGPMTPWVRIFSNGTGQISNGLVPRSAYLNKSGGQSPNDSKPYDGFILKGGDGFYDAFGYNNTTPLTQKGAIIGYQANGEPHFIDPSLRSLTNYQSRVDNNFPQDNVVPSILPPPGIVSVQLRQSRELLTFASFKFNCYSLAQLEYMMPFFLTPGINMFIEFGWNLYNQKSLLNLTDDECWKIVSEPQKALDRANLSYGNYGCVTGIVTKYNFTTQNGFVYECNVECTSRQGLFAGFRTDNNATKDLGTTSNEYINLKDFIKIYLPSINETVKSRSNFIDFVIANKTAIANKYAEKSKEAADAQANQEQLSKQQADIIKQAINAAPKPTVVGKSPFYNGQPEDRVFLGRREDIYAGKKLPSANSFVPSRAAAATAGGRGVAQSADPNRPGTRAAAAAAAGQVGNQTSTNPAPPGSRAAAAAAAGYQGNPVNPSTIAPVIQYGSVTTFVSGKSTSAQQISYADKTTDFDANDTNDEVWMQLDFVFELINVFCSNPANNLYVIDNQDIIINAHPNLISCDKNVLIPNPVAPKVNKGGKFLSDEQKNFDKNIFVDSNKHKSDFELYQKSLTPADRKNKNIEPEKSLIIAATSAAKTFGIPGLFRDDLDRVINWFYYNSANTWAPQSASFPFAQDKVIYDDEFVNVLKKYKKYYYGHLKNLYISKSRLMEIANDENVNTLKQFVTAILSTINNAVDDFWKFDIVDGTNGKLSIIDKNTMNTDTIKKVYMFDLAKTNNVVKSINFDVSLTNEQANNVLFAGANSPSLTETFEDKINKANTKAELDIVMTQVSNTPYIKFRDRLDVYQLKQIGKLKGEELVKAQQSGNIPGTNVNFKDENNDIANIQVYGDVSRNEILCMRFLNITEADKQILTSGGELKEPKYDWKYLCLPPNMKAKLRRMLDDGDVSGNIAKYSGVADNFQISMTLDGLYGFRNLQVFAISNLPKPYVPGNVIFQILEVEHNLAAGKWETNITALLRCIAGTDLEYINI